MSTQTFLVEIGTEELPPKALKKLSNALGSEIQAGLKEQELSFKDLKVFSSPRRLSVLVSDLAAQQDDKEVERRGPAVKAAFDENGEPTKAAQGFAKSCGVEVADLDSLETDKGTWLVYSLKEKGKSVTELLPLIVSNALNKLPIPKRMRWGSGDAAFVRPVHWIVMLFGDQIIDAEILSIKSGNVTYGHRFHFPEAILISNPDEYEQQLEIARVVVNFDKRRDLISDQVNKLADEIGGQAVLDPDLLDEVTGMVEWPVALSGEIDPGFLELPDEVLISTMASHQKYFHVVHENGERAGKLMPYFITVSNIESSNPAAVKQGNERVVRPRLSDSAHFWKTDLATDFSVWEEALEKVVFQDKLGSIADKSKRVSKLAADIVTILQGSTIDITNAKRAALLSKCDLMSEMVGEFPDLQGTMGRYYAEHHQESAEIALALEEQYMPRFAGDQIPSKLAGQALAIADKLDTLVGIFGIGQAPTGAKDPFALRRASLGCLRIIIEAELDLDLKDLLQKAASNLDEKTTEPDVVDQVFNYMLERLRAYYSDQKLSSDIYDAVVARRPGKPYDFDLRMRAVQTFRKLPEAASLAAANKRIGNILKKLDQQPASEINSDLLEEPAEQELVNALTSVRENISEHLKAQNYNKALAGMAVLREPVDTFFDEVMVNCDDEKVKNNRQALLAQLRSLFMEIADISCLQS
ncbi:MAG: glycine--tRNA ligase subunit beta [Gammaproteobacteria bacterium]